MRRILVPALVVTLAVAALALALRERPGSAQAAAEHSRAVRNPSPEAAAEAPARRRRVSPHAADAETETGPKSEPGVDCVVPEIAPAATLPLEVRLVDGRTGGGVDLPRASVHVARADLSRADVFRADLSRADGGTPLVEHTDLAGATVVDDVFQIGGGSQSVVIDVTPSEFTDLHADPLRESHLTATLSRFATSFVVIEPLRPEGHLLVRPLLPDGSLAPASAIQGVDYVGMPEPVIERIPGGFEIRGFAHLAGEPIGVFATHEGLSASARTTLRCEPSDAPLVEMRLAANERRGGRRTLRCGGCRGRMVRDGTARLEILALDAGGAPLVEVWIDAGLAGRGRTDANGVLVLTGIPDGSHHVRLIEPGIVYADAHVRLAEGESRTITLREGPSYDLSVTVLREDGEPARFARIAVTPDQGAPWVHLVDGVQTLTVMTDERGHCRLPRLPNVRIALRARFGSRDAHVDLEPGADGVTLTLGREGAVLLK